MTSLALPAVQQPSFSASASEAERTITVRLSGTADGQAHPYLDRYLKALHEEACRLGTPQVTVDLGALQFINSSCLMLFVTWLTWLHDLEAGRQYRVTLSSSTKHQRRSFAALANVALGLVTVQ
jgi:hypothetical protein